jgi:hypothetical protein
MRGSSYLWTARGRDRVEMLLDPVKGVLPWRSARLERGTEREELDVVCPAVKSFSKGPCAKPKAASDCESKSSRSESAFFSASMSSAVGKEFFTDVSAGFRRPAAARSVAAGLEGLSMITKTYVSNYRREFSTIV